MSAEQDTLPTVCVMTRVTKDLAESADDLRGLGRFRSLAAMFSAMVQFCCGEGKEAFLEFVASNRLDKTPRRPRRDAAA